MFFLILQSFLSEPESAVSPPGMGGAGRTNSTLDLMALRESHLGQGQGAGARQGSRAESKKGPNP